MTFYQVFVFPFDVDLNRRQTLYKKSYAKAEIKSVLEV